MKELGYGIFVVCIVSTSAKKGLQLLGAFVIACSLLCTTLVKLRDLGIAHDHLLKFCKELKKIYGKRRVTPNMHLHMHLADCVLDYGPVYGFWLFSFERYNGILGKYPTNNKSVELQMMRKFIRD